MSTQLGILAARLRELPGLPAFKQTGDPVGYYRRSTDNFFSVQVRFGPTTFTLGETLDAVTAAAFSDCCQHWFAPWLRRNRNKLATFNCGPVFAVGVIIDRPDVHALLVDLENELTKSGAIRPRAEKEAGLNAKATDETLQGLLERVTALERRMSEYDVKRGRPAAKPTPPITTFLPPGSMKHAEKNYVHHESINPTIAKSIFKI